MTQERWNTFSRQTQIGHIGSEILRANAWKKDPELFKNSIAKALEYTYLSLADTQWRSKHRYLSLLIYKLAQLYVGEDKDALLLYNSL